MKNFTSTEKNPKLNVNLGRVTNKRIYRRDNKKIKKNGEKTTMKRWNSAFPITQKNSRIL